MIRALIQGVARGAAIGVMLFCACAIGALLALCGAGALPFP